MVGRNVVPKVLNRNMPYFNTSLCEGQLTVPYLRFTEAINLDLVDIPSKVKEILRNACKETSAIIIFPADLIISSHRER